MSTSSVLPDGTSSPSLSWRRVCLFIGIVLLLRIVYLFLSPWDLVADEAHYWEWSRRVDWSYYTKGPGVSWVIWLSTHLLGTSAGAVRVPAAIASALMTLAGARLALDITRGNVRAAWYAALALTLVPGYFATAQLLTTDVFYSSAWVVTTLFVFHAVCGERSSAARALAWFGVGASIGIGFLFKYTELLILPGLAIWFWTARKQLVGRSIGVGIAIVCVAFLLASSPVWIWNVEHGWPTIAHQLGRLHLPGGDEKVRFSWSPMWFLGFVGSQFGLLGVVGAVLIWVAVAHERRRLREPYPRDDRRALGASLLVWASAPLLAIYLVVSLFAQTQGNWAIAAYATPLVLAGIVLGEVLPFDRTRRLPLRNAWNWFVAVGIGAGLVILIGPAIFWIPGVTHIKKLSDTAKRTTYGSTLAANVNAVRGTLARPGVPLLVVADSYQDASWLAFYLPDRPVTFAARHLLGGRPTAYDFFPDTDLHADRLRGSDAILVLGDLDRWSSTFAFDSIEPVPNAHRLFIARNYGGVRAGSTTRPADAGDSDD